MKRIIIVHGWDGTPNSDWYPWLKKELESRGYSVLVPQMPGAERPKIATWVGHLKKTVGSLDKDTYFVGHSMGCQTIMRYLAAEPNTKVGGILFVAGFFYLENLEDEDARRVADPWRKEPIDYDKIEAKTNKIVVINSDNDQWVTVENAELFKRRLKAKAVIEHGLGHFNGKSYPIILKELLKIIG